MKKAVQNVDAYILDFPKDIQEHLETIRTIIRKAAPKAEEGIAYQMPAYKMNGPLVYFGGAKNHIGFYPTPSAIVHFEKELKEYKTSKGAIQFPLDKKLPATLISKIVKFRLQENEEKARAKKK